MAAETGLRALSILELDDTDPLDRLFPHPEETCRYLRDDVIIVGYELVRITAFTGAAERAESGCRPHAGEHGNDTDRAKRHAAQVEGHGDRDLRPRIS